MSTTFRRGRSGLYIPSSGIDPFDAAVLADSPDYYYKFDETSGSTLFDHSGNGLDGTAVNAPTPTGANGWTLNGTNQRFTIPGTLLPTGDSPYTLEAVFKPSSVSGQRDLLAFGLSTTSKTTAFGLNGTNAWNYWNGSNVTTAGVTFNTTTWYHLVATYDQANVNIYVQAINRASAARSAHAATNGSPNVGASIATSAFFAGSYRRLAIYHTALSSTRVTAHEGAAPLT